MFVSLCLYHSDVGVDNGEGHYRQLTCNVSYSLKQTWLFETLHSNCFVLYKFCAFLERLMNSMSLKQAVYKKGKDIPDVQNVHSAPILQLIDKILEYIKSCTIFSNSHSLGFFGSSQFKLV